MTVNRDSDYVKVLSRSLDRIVDLQKFAEAKNASLLAFSSVWIAGLGNLLASGHAAPPGFRSASMIALGLFIIAAITAIASLQPRFIHLSADGSEAASPNMLFFGDIEKVPVAYYIAGAQKRYFPDEGCFATEALFVDLLRQTAVVSRISVRKYRLFNRAATAALFGIGVFLVPVIGLLVDVLR